MSGVAAILRRSSLPAAGENLMELYVGPSISSASSRGISSFAKRPAKLGTSVLGHTRAVDRFSRVSPMPLSAHIGAKWMITPNSSSNALPGPLATSSICRAYSSDAGIKPEVPVPPTESAEAVITGAGTWMDLLENARSSTIDATTDACKKVKEMTDAVTPHVQQFFEAHPDMEKVVVLLGGTLFGTVMAWFIMPIILKRLHQYGSQNPISALLGNSTKTDASYPTILWSALENPAKYFITFMAFSEMAAVIAPSITPYFPQALRGAFVLSTFWFLHRWKANFQHRTSCFSGTTLDSFDLLVVPP